MTTRSARLALLLAATVALGGCATNAVLELTVALPADSAAHYAVVQARSSNDFSAIWAGSGIDGTLLSPSGPTTLNVSVVADDDMTQKGVLGVRVRYCTTHDCSAIADGSAPESQFVFARAFYRGKVTRYTITITAIPTMTATTPTAIAKCSVAGCIEGSTGDYCRADHMTHFCE